MQVSRGNILKTIGMLCNPNFIKENNQYFNLNFYIFPLPTCIFTKDGKSGNACFHQAELTLCFSDQVLVLLCLPRSIKGKCLLSWRYIDTDDDMRRRGNVQQGKPDP